MDDKAQIFFDEAVNKISSKLSYYRYKDNLDLSKPSNGRVEELRLHFLRLKMAGDMVVRDGIFKGIKFPAQLPEVHTKINKILGCYESELYDTIDDILAGGIEQFIDIGCAEGYYCVGMARRLKELNRSSGKKVFAYDIKKSERDKCEMFAIENNLLDQVSIEEKCDEGKLMSFSSDKPTLVLCDCEGFEKELFTTKISEKFKNWHFLVEVHDFVDRSISDHLTDVFQNTHKKIVINNITDMDKALNVDFGDFNDKLDVLTKTILITERRPEMMQWFYFQPVDM